MARLNSYNAITGLIEIEVNGKVKSIVEKNVKQGNEILRMCEWIRDETRKETKLNILENVKKKIEQLEWEK